MVVVDSSVWIDYLRRTDSDAGRRLDDLLERHEVLMTGVVLAEVLQGASGERDHVRLESALEAAAYVEVTRAAWVRAGRLSRELRGSGQAVPLTDLIIAAIAVEGDHELFTFDPDFQRVPGLRLYDWKGGAHA
ncbi:MAG TPA: PIN domain-containing protein [Dehalococcoidia bacterium]